MMLKNRWKKAACLILTIISTVCLGKVDVKAADYWPDAPETLSPGVILMEESTGTILYEKNMEKMGCTRNDFWYDGGYCWLWQQ